MSAQTVPRATLDDLMQVDGPAELINGRIIRFMPSGFFPSQVAFRISISLAGYVAAGAPGVVVTDPTGYAFDPPLPSGRQSICPDSSLYTGALPANRMKFIPGAPVFAAEVRSENDYGLAKEREHAANRADCFEAGTLVVWDVDPVAETVTSYTSAAPDAPTAFRRGDTADAEPAVPGWRLSVDALFA